MEFTSALSELLYYGFILAVTGAVVGWLASRIGKGLALGLMGEVLVGIIGAIVIGGLLVYTGVGLIFHFFLAFFMPIAAAIVVTLIVNGVVGAVVLLFLVALFKKKPAAAQH